MPAQRRRRLARRARPLRVKKLSNFVCVKPEALTTRWRAESRVASPRPCPARCTGPRSVPPAVLGWPGNFCTAQRRIGSFSRLLPRWKKFARTRASSLIFCFSSHFKSYSLCPPPPPPPRYHPEIQKCLEKPKRGAGPGGAGDSNGFPRSCYSQEVEFASIFFFFSFERGVPATKTSFFYRAIAFLSPTSFPSVPSFHPTSQIRSLPVQPA